MCLISHICLAKTAFNKIFYPIELRTLITLVRNLCKNIITILWHPLNKNLGETTLEIF